MEIKLAYRERFIIIWTFNQGGGIDELGARTLKNVRAELKLDDTPFWNPLITQNPGEREAAFRGRIEKAGGSEATYTTSLINLEWIRGKMEDRFDLSKGGGYPPQFSVVALSAIERIRELIRVERERLEAEKLTAGTVDDQVVEEDIKETVDKLVDEAAA